MILNDLGAVCGTDAEMCNAFNEFFTSVFTVEDTSSVPSTKFTVSEAGIADIEDVDLTLKVVADKLALLRADKATGTDDLSPRLLNLRGDQKPNIRTANEYMAEITR